MTLQQVLNLIEDYLQDELVDEILQMTDEEILAGTSPEELERLRQWRDSLVSKLETDPKLG